MSMQDISLDLESEAQMAIIKAFSVPFMVAFALPIKTATSLQPSTSQRFTSTLSMP